MTGNDLLNEIFWKVIWLIYIGMFWLLSFLYLPLILLKKFRKEPIEIKKLETILVLKFGHIGDTVLTLPVLKALKESFPRVQIVFVVASWAKEVLLNSPYVDKLIVFDDPFDNRIILTEPNIVRKLKRIHLQEILKFIIMIRSLNCDVVFDLNGTYRSFIFTYLSGAKHKIGYDWQGVGYLLDAKVKHTEDKEEVQRCFDVIRTLGVNTDVKGPFIFLSGRDRLQAEKYLKDINVHENELLIGIHPGAPFIPRRWPMERFAKVADELDQKFGAKIIFFGGSDEVDLVDNIIELMEKPAFNLAGKTTIRQTMAVIERCNLFICNDSSLMHIAAMLNIPIIALFGPGRYPQFAPYNEDSVVIREDVGCNPCNEGSAVWRKMCKRGKAFCMDAITIQKVLKIVEELINKISNG